MMLDRLFAKYFKNLNMTYKNVQFSYSNSLKLKEHKAAYLREFTLFVSG